jgi:hypothetical protein
MTTTITTAEKLIGQALIDHASQNTLIYDGNKSELCKAAGYVKTVRGGSLGADFVGFYEALLAAKQEANPDLFRSESDYPDYDSLPEDRKELYDHLSDDIARSWKHEQTVDFIGELEDIGIETKDQLDDAFNRCLDNSWKAEAEFAEELMVEIEPGLSGSLIFHAIDWQSVWDHQVKYDYNTIEFDGCVYFFRNC